MLIDPGIRRSGDAVIAILSFGIGTLPFNHGCAFIAAKMGFTTQPDADNRQGDVHQSKMCWAWMVHNKIGSLTF